MKICIADIETFGLALHHSVFEIGLMIEDTINPKLREETPQLRIFVDCQNDFKASNFALQMHIKSGLYNEWINAPIGPPFYTGENHNYNGTKLCPKKQVGAAIQNWLTQYFASPKEKITFGGKNFSGFDKPRLDFQIPNWLGNLAAHHRTFDLGSFFFDPSVDAELPSLQTCMERASINGEVAHNSLDDCWAVIQCMRKKYGKNQ